jgi:hypothetical protein
MKKNMGWADRIIRFIIAVVVVLLYKFDVISGTLAVILLIVSGIFILTSFISYCPLYVPFGINTRRKEK